MGKTKNTKNIRRLRERSGLSQSEFAGKFYIKIKTLQSWEQGWRRVPDSIYFLVRRILELEGFDVSKL